MLLIGGVTFSVRLLSAEYYLSLGARSFKLGDKIEAYRQADYWYPFHYTFRNSAAITLGIEALKHGQEVWYHAATPELKYALIRDKSSPELLMQIIAINLALKNFDDAKLYYEIFKKVAKNSELVKKLESFKKD